MDPKQTPNRVAVPSQDPVDLNRSTLPKTGASPLMMTAIMGALMLGADPGNSANAKEAVSPAAATSTKSKGQDLKYEDMIKKISSLASLSEEDKKHIIKNQDVYADALVKVIADKGLSSDQAYNIISGLGSEITSEKFQKGIIKLLPNCLDRSMNEFAIRQLCSAVKVDSEVFDYAMRVIKTENGGDVYGGLVALQDPELQKKAYPAIKEFAERTGHTYALIHTMKAIPESQREDYLFGIAAASKDKKIDVLGMIRNFNLDGPKSMALLERQASSNPQGLAMLHLQRCNHEKGTQLLIKFLENPETRVQALIGILNHDNKTAKIFLADPKIDFSKWTEKDLKTLRDSENYNKLNSESEKKQTHELLQKKVRSFLTDVKFEDKLDYYDELQIIYKKSDPKGEKSFNQFLIEQLDSEKDARIIKSFTAAEKLGINNPSRFNIDTLEKIIAARLEPKCQGDKYILFVAPKVEADGAFQNMPEYEEFIKQGYKVLYYEAGNDNQDLKKIALDCQRKELHSDGIFFVGHGSKSGIALGTNDMAVDKINAKNEDLYLDISDAKQLQEYGFDKIVKDSQFIIAGGCHNGEGANNLQGILQKTFEQQNVLAPVKEYLYADIIFKDGRFVGLKFIYPEDLQKSN